MAVHGLIEWTAKAGRRWPVLRACACVAYACARLFVPANSKQIAFCSHPDCSDNAYALFEQVMKSPRAREFRIVWLAKDPEAARRILARDHPPAEAGHIRVVAKDTLRGLFWFLRSRYVFFTAGVYWFAQSGTHQTIVNLWHGMPIKRIGAFVSAISAQPPFAHYSLATSAFFADLMAQAFAMPRDRILVTGLPRNEWLFQSDPRHLALRGTQSKLVVWLPTFRNWVDERRAWTDTDTDSQDPITPERLAALDSMLDGAGALLILKFHPGDSRRLQMWPEYRNIRLYTHQRFQDEHLNLYKLLACSDALITDYSSVAIDYLLLQRPIGFFVPDHATYARGFMPGVWERISTLGRELKSVEELAAFVKELPPPPPVTPEMEDLFQRDLLEPSAAVLRAVGLGVLLPADGISAEGCVRVMEDVGVNAHKPVKELSRAAETKQV